MAMAKEVEDWGQIDPEVFDKFAEAVEKLREKMIPRDCDGTSPIDVHIVNRMTHTMTAMPVPKREIYSYDIHGHVRFRPDIQAEMNLETLKWLIHNVAIVSRALDNYYSLVSYEAEVQKDNDAKSVRYCSECFAELRKYNSRRGVEDKNICVNPYCKKDNSET